MQKNYNTTDMEMLMIAGTIVENAISNQVFLQARKNTWSGNFFIDLKTKINKACRDYFGADDTVELRQSVLLLKDIHKSVLKDLFVFKMQLAEDLKDDEQKYAQILTLLGFTAYYPDAHDKDKEALINLLAQFRLNASPELREELLKIGISRNLLAGIIEYDKILKRAGITPGKYKSVDKELPVKATKILNEIYVSVLQLCKTASKFYKGNEQVREKFNYKEVAKWLNIKRSASTIRLRAA